MATKNFGKLQATISADSTEFKKGLSDAAKEAEGFKSKVTNELNSIKMSTAGMTGIFTTIGAGLVVNELKQVVQETINAAIELDKLSKVAGVTTDEFQQVSFGAQKLGMDSEKLSDLLKDVNEKFGETIATGGGPLKDFFDVIAPKVGVTAEQFRKLSGPDALQLYYDSLIKAGAGQKEVTFYMEALVSDGSKLIPMLQNAGAGFKAAADEAERLGLVMSKETIAEAKRLNEEMKTLDMSMSAFKQTVGISVIPVLNDLVKFVKYARAEYGLLGAAIAAVGGGTLAIGGVDLNSVSRARAAIIENGKDLEALRKKQAEAVKGRDNIDNPVGKWLANGTVESLNAKIAEKEKEFKINKNILMADDWRNRNKQNAEDEAAAKRKAEEDKAAAENSARISAEKNKKTGSSKTKSKIEKESAPSDFETGADYGKVYGDVLGDLIQKSQELDAETANLSSTESGLIKLFASPEWSRMPIEMRQAIIAQSDLNIAKADQAKAQKEINDLIAATPTAKLDEQRQLMERLSQAYLDNKFGVAGTVEAIEKYGQVVNTALGNTPAKLEAIEDKVFSISSAMDSTSSKMADSFMDFALGAKTSFSDLAKSIMVDISKMIIQQQIFNALKSVMPSNTSGASIFATIGNALISTYAGKPTTPAPTVKPFPVTIESANGNVFSSGIGGPSLIPFANGGVFNSPMTFGMAGGRTGLMAEEGPEAIIPLSRRNGVLGVNASGLGGNTSVLNQVSVTVNAGNNANADEIGAKASEAVMRALAQSEIVKATRHGGILAK